MNIPSTIYVQMPPVTSWAIRHRNEIFSTDTVEDMRVTFSLKEMLAAYDAGFNRGSALFRDSIARDRHFPTKHTYFLKNFNVKI